MSRTHLFIFLLLPVFVGCKEATVKSTYPVPRGSVDGLELHGHLKGKTAYLVDEGINWPGCWLDSPYLHKDGLYFAGSAIHFSKLMSGKGFSFSSDCRLPANHTGKTFDIYRAERINKEWKLEALNINSKESDAGMSISKNILAYTIYYDKNWEIELAERKDDITWKKIGFNQNTKCNEDNPEIFANGTRMIFESTRKDTNGKSCFAQKEEKNGLWYSERNRKGAWSTPKLLEGPPNEGDKNTQPWVDEKNGYLYWTANKDKDSIKRIAFDGKRTSGKPEYVIRPALDSLWKGNAHGKAVFIGDYSESEDYAVFVCAIARKGGPFMKKWSIDLRLCTIPLKDQNNKKKNPGS